MNEIQPTLINQDRLAGHRSIVQRSLGLFPKELLSRYTITSILISEGDSPLKLPDDQNHQKCMLCNLSSDETKFSGKAHLIPSLFGNDLLFSSSECDSCNHILGQKYDNELAKFIAPYRPIFKVSTKRKGIPSHKTKSKNSSVSFTEGYVTLERNSDLIKMRDCGNNERILEIWKEKINHKFLFPAIARIGLLILPKSDKLKYELFSNSLASGDGPNWLPSSVLFTAAPEISDNLVYTLCLTAKDVKAEEGLLSTIFMFSSGKFSFQSVLISMIRF